MLLSQAGILKLICCPKSGRPLKVEDNILCGKTAEGTLHYEIIDNYPILIDFENSILKKEEMKKSLSSVIKRGSSSWLLTSVKHFILPPQSVTSDNVKQILHRLKTGNNGKRVLIVGGGTVGNGMDPFYKDASIDLVSFDIYASPNVQFVADAHNIPLLDNSFDAVIIQAVLEHVLVPEKVILEIYRVLKNDGIVYSETPFLQHVHEGPYDFTRYTESGHRYLFRKFKLIDSGVTAGAGTQLLWSLDNFFRGLFRSRVVGKVIKVLFFWLQFFDRLIPDSYNTDSASGVYFLGIKQDAEFKNEDIIAHYKGAQK